MAKLNNNQINDALDEELGKEDIKSRISKMKESAREQDSSEGETFSIDKFSYNFRTVSDAEDLKEGTSYSEHMLDLNELMEKGVLQRGNKIDLSDMPEIETIQVATQEQLNMLTPESKKQITAIHLSNNTPVGWDDNYDFDNKSAMDEKLDLSSYHNVTEVQTHFYVNNDLQDIVMPEKATELLCRHSKMENLQKDGGLQDVKVVLDKAQTAFGEDDGYVDEGEDRIARIVAEYNEENKEAGKNPLYYYISCENYSYMLREIDFKNNRDIATKCLREIAKHCSKDLFWNRYWDIENAKIFIEHGARFGDERGYDEFGKRLEDYDKYGEIALAMSKAKVKDAQERRGELSGNRVEDKSAASPKQANQTTLSVQDMKNAKSDLVK